MLRFLWLLQQQNHGERTQTWDLPPPWPLESQQTLSLQLAVDQAVEAAAVGVFKKYLVPL